MARFHAKGPSARHEAAVPRLPTTGLRDAIREQLGADPGPLRLVADAYMVDAAAKSLTLYEVIVTHEITPDKRRKLTALAAWLADRGWAFKLMLGDSSGGWIEGDPSTGRPTEAAVEAAVADVFRRFP